ncbi:MBL fold metallo-hydrolase [Tissierella creatinophila]|uniref:Beta-lactamase superfamily domain protein n=1 Tax=Tissierella creatinophila DSM 6911 TaxID=1123403 RepID=A0A1U7M2M2_TISCR|nr:MBL fold metallo-hydrolase [Tissierella creatinophila]OLS01500.1 beta-lactamase superfamily domain protein [Tissierella creatinophila DSM 6911]
MENLDVKVEYIFHSGFTVETRNHFLIFDYYQGDLKLKDKKTYIFSTHSHYDHFNPDILDLKGEIKYIFSDDIKIESKREIYFMRAYKTLLLDDLKIKTFSSTDLGVSFLVQVDGVSIFFAGDLNWWSWNSDTQKERDTMEYLFKKKVDRIEGEKIDIAFFPVDPRLAENYSLGGEYFIEKFHPTYFFQMHFGDNYEKVEDFIHKMRDKSTKVVSIEHKNQVFNL